MTQIQSLRCSAFAGSRRIASGAPVEVALAVKAALESSEATAILVFDDATGEPVEFDLRGTPAEVRERLTPVAPAPPAPAPAAAGRPRLGVVAREVTLLPRHWDWLASQPGGASAALRRLVEAARRDLAGEDRARRSHTTLYRVMSALAGDFAAYEEATRALFAHDYGRLNALMAAWPADVRDHLRELASRAKADETPAADSSALAVRTARDRSG